MRNKILIVGQTPPPYGGQAMIIKRILDAKYESVQLYHIRMSFSKEMSNIGKFEMTKIFHLCSILMKIYYVKFRYNIEVLYYPPSGPHRIPIYRDMIILLCTRWLFKKTIFQFFAGGLTDFLIKGNSLELFFFKKSFFYPDLALRPSTFCPRDGEILLAKNELIIPWGNEDNLSNFPKKTNKDVITILFAGVLIESKGIFILMEACRLLSLINLKIKVNILGTFGSEEIQKNLYKFIEENGLTDTVNFDGVQTGERYYECFSEADIFCLPSFFEAENLPVVIIDAVQFGLPVVSTRWRAIPEIVIDGSNGFLVDIKNYSELAQKLELLINSSQLRNEMGRKSRELYLQKYTEKVFIKRTENAFRSVCESTEQ